MLDVDLESLFFIEHKDVGATSVGGVGMPFDV